MSWANIDDRFHSHPKVRKLQRLGTPGAEALGIWAWCLSWCRAYSPDEGRVTVEEVSDAWNAEEDHIAEVFKLLLRVRLVDEELFGTYLIHDWADWQLGGAERQAAAGKARAATAERDEHGRFLPLGASRLDQQSSSSGKQGQAGDQPGHATPLPSNPATPADAGARPRGGPPARIDSELRRRAPWTGRREG